MWKIVVCLCDWCPPPASLQKSRFSNSYLALLHENKSWKDIVNFVIRSNRCYDYKHLKKYTFNTITIWITPVMFMVWGIIFSNWKTKRKYIFLNIALYLRSTHLKWEQAPAREEKQKQIAYKFVKIVLKKGVKVSLSFHILQ